MLNIVLRYTLFALFILSCVPATASMDFNELAQTQESPASLMPNCCGIAAGDRVIATVDHPQAANLMAGAIGTVICCDPDSPIHPLLVSWDGWSDGHDNLGSCELPSSPIPGPSDSHLWVDCDEIAPVEDLFWGFEPGDRVRVMFDHSNGAPGLEKGSTGTVVCYPLDLLSGEVYVAFDGWNGGEVSPDCIMDYGVIWPFDSTAWAISCIDIEPLANGCDLKVGDSVRYMGGGDVENLEIGTMGTVVCAGSRSYCPREFQVLVSWNDWTSGHSITDICIEQPDVLGPTDSHFWMRCSEIALIEPANCGFEPGDRVQLRVDEPDGSETLHSGDRGTVVCIINKYGAPYNILVSWDSWTDGHNGFGVCDIPETPEYGPGNSHWYVHCRDIGHLHTCCDFTVGDRAELTEDVPSWHLSAGAVGSVVCVCENGALPLLISFDDYTQGHNNIQFCDNAPELGRPNSHYWVACDQVIHAPCCGFKKGDRVVLRVSDPDGGAIGWDPKGMPKGLEGTVACCSPDNVDGSDLLVHWDDIDIPHNLTLSCSEIPLFGEGGEGCWWVNCSDVRAASYSGWDQSDFDQNMCTDLQDFLYLLDKYQTHLYLDHFLTLLDYWQLGLRCNKL